MPDKPLPPMAGHGKNLTSRLRFCAVAVSRTSFSRRSTLAVEAVQREDALHMRKSHLDLLAFAA
jgi:hypothetical protein